MSDCEPVHSHLLAVSTGEFLIPPETSPLEMDEVGSTQVGRGLPQKRHALTETGAILLLTQLNITPDHLALSNNWLLLRLFSRQ